MFGKYVDEIKQKLEKEKADQLYRNMLNDALKNTAAYARQGAQQRQEVADTLVGGGMTKLKRGDVSSLDRDVIRASVIDNASALRAMSQTGIFNSPEYATNPLYKTLPGSNYLKELQDALQMQHAASIVSDDFAKTSKGRTAETENRWLQLYEDKDNKNEAGQWYNWLMADYLLGDRKELFDFEKINAKYEAMDDETYYAEEDRLRNQFNSLDWETLTGSKTNKYESQTPILKGQMETVSGELKRRQIIQEMEALAKSNPEYASLAVYKDNYTPPERSMFGQNQYAPYINGLDELNRFINVGGTYTSKQVAAEHSLQVASYLNNGYDYLTDDEIATYNVLYNTDQEKAATYLEALRSDLLYRRAEAEKAWTETKATNSYLAVPSWIDARINTLGNVGALPLQALEAATGRDDPYSAAYDAVNKAQYVTGAQLEALGDIEALEWTKVFGKNLAQHLYSGVSSAADNAIRAAAGPTGALVLAGAQSASGSLQESAARDDMVGAAKIVKALLTAGAEVGTEKIGLDALFDKSKTGAVDYIKGVIGAELGEETLNYLSEDAIEAAVAFMFGHEADIKSAPEFWQGLGETALQTLISSVLMGSGGAIAKADANRTTGKQIKTNGDFNEIIDIASGMNPSTESYQLSQEAKANMEKGKTISLNMMGRIANAMSIDLGKERSQIINEVMEGAIAGRLVELGADEETAKANAPAVRKIANGEDLTAKEKKAVQWDDNASQVVKELASKNETKQERIEVEGAPAAEPEGQRTGQKWKTEMVSKLDEKIGEVEKKQTGLMDALSTPVAEDVQKAVEAAEKKTSPKNAKEKNATNKGIAFATQEGESKGEFQRFEMKDGEVQVVVKSGETETTVKVEDLTDEGGAGTAAIIEYAATSKHKMTAEEANTMMQVYEKTGGNVKKFITDFEAVYAAGFAGINAPTTGLSVAAATTVYEQAQREAAETEEKRVERAKALRKSTQGSVAWLGQVESNAAIRGKGDAEALSGAMESMTESQRNTVEVVQALADGLRVNIVLYEGLGKNLGNLANGRYEPSTHTLYVDVNSGAASAKGIQAGKATNTLGYAMMRTLGHELTHHIESTSAEFYAQYKAAVKKQLQENGQSWAELVRGKIENALAEGRKLTRMGAEAEVVADASEYMLQESSFTKKLDSGLYAKVKTFVQSFMEKVREIFTHITGEHRESAALRKVIDGVKQYTGNLQELWDAALEETIQGESALEEAADDVDEKVEEAQFSAREKYDFSKSFAEQVDDWKNGNFPERDTLLLGRTPDVLQKIGFSDLPMTIDQKHMRYMMGTPKNNDHDLGEDIVKRLPELIADPVAIIANPAPTKGSRAPGVMIIFAETNNNANGRRIVGAVSVLENGSINGITIDSTRLETAHSRGDVDKKIADAVQKEQSGGDGVYYINKDALSLLEPGQSQVLGTLGRYGVINSIREAPEFVNSKFLKQTETTQFKRWFGDSKIVNEDGSPKVMYHGTPYGGFTVFKGWQYFTDNKWYADQYQNPSASSIRGRYPQATNPQTYEVYLKVKKPFDTRDKKVRKIWQEEFYGNYSRTPLSERGLPDWTDGIDLVDFIEENGYDYDAIILDEGGVGGYGDEVKDRGVSVVVRDATQIKSATDNVGTFDPENPDIMYSTRDLPDSVSIREYLGAMKPTSRMTETEKELLGRYQKKLAELQEKERLVAEQDEIIKTAPATSQELMKAKNRYQVYRQQANRIARELARLERAEGFAGIMATSQTIVNEYLSGATGSVADAQDALETEIQGLTNRLKVIGNTVEGTAQGQRNAFARGLFNQVELNRAAKQLKDSYNSRMSVKTIADRLALAYGEIYANEGAEGAKRFANAAKELAQDILDSSRYRYRSEILSTIAEEVPTISLTESDLQEIKNAGMTITEYKRGLSPYVKVAEGASDLSSYVTNAESYGGRIGQILGDDTEGNLAMALYNVIQAERASEATATLEGMSESASLGAVLADVASVNLPMSTSDTTLEYLRKELKKYAGENEQAAQSVDAAIRAAKNATARASAVWREAVKAQDIARRAVEYYRALEEQRRLIELQEQKELLTEQLKTDAAKKLGEKASKMRQEYREREQRAREYRQTRDEVNKLRRGIGRTVRYLNTRRAHESDQRHIPHEMTKIVDYILAEFTDEKLARLSFSAKQAANLNSLYNKLKASDTDNTYFWDDEVEKKLRYIYDLSEEYHNLLYDESGKRRPPSLEGYEHEREMLTNIGDVIENIRRMVDAENEIFLEDKDDTFLEYSTNTAKALLERKDVHLLRGAAGDVQKIVNELLWTGNMTPVYFFERLQNDGLLTAFNAVRDGQRKYGRILNEAKKFVLESKERHHYDRWVGDGLLTFKTVQGHKITLTREQALWAYATAKREESLELKKTEHLSKGGFHFRNPREDMGAKGLYRATDKAHQLKAADIQTINNWLTKEQKAYADELVEYLSTTMGDYGNEASMRMYGYKKFREQYYFPFSTWSAQQFQRGDEGSTNTGEASRIMSAGFTKSLTHKANTALEMSDFTDVIGDHIQAMTTYATMVAPVEDIKRLMNHKVADTDGTQSTVRALIGQKYGLASQNYVTDFLRDLNGAVQTDNRAGGGIEKLISTFKRGAVAGSLSVVVQQPTAIFRAMAYVSPKYFSMNRETKNDGKLWEEMLRYSGAAVVKDAGKFDIGLGRSAADWVTGQDIMNPVKAFMRMKEQRATKAGKESFDVFKEWMTFLPGVADQVTWKAMWKAVKNEQHALHPEMDTSSEAFLEMCGKRFDDVMDHTQVYDSVLVKSNLMRSKNQLHKMATSFMSEPTLTLNIMIDALKGKHGWKQGAKMVAATVVSQIAAGTLAALVQAWNDDDDERNAKEKLLDRALYNIAGNLNPIETIPYLSNIWDTVEGFTVQRSDMEVINDLVTYTKQVANGNLSGWLTVEKLGGTIANIFGVPLGNIMRDFRRGKNAIESEWGKSDRENLGFITQKNLQWFWADSKKAYYNRMVNAALNGEMEYYEEMMEYMLTSKMADKSSIDNGMRGVLKKMVQSGEMAPEEATAFLNKYASYANQKDNTKKPLEWAAEKD